MKRRVYFLISILFLIQFFSSLIFPQEKNVTVIAESGNVPPGSDIFITGSLDEFGYWETMQVMEKLSGKRWKYTITAQKGDTIHFKFTRGSWRSEAVDSAGTEFYDFTHVVKKDTTIIYRIPNWRDLARQKILITPKRLNNKSGYLELYEGWKYKLGDDSSWADPSFNDSGWKTIQNPLMNEDEFRKMNWDWSGNIWFRNHITIDSTLLDKTFGFRFFNTGAAEVYLNGRLLYKFGRVGKSAETENAYFDRTPRHLTFTKDTLQLLAVRYSNFSAEKEADFEIPFGFNALLADLNLAVSDRLGEVRENSILQMAFSAFLLAFAIMHFLLFIFFPKSKENLFYSISMFSFAVVVYCSVQPNFANSISSIIDISILNSASAQLALLFGLLTVYASSYNRLPRQYIPITILAGLFILHTIFFPLAGAPYTEYTYLALALAIIIEILRIMIRSIFRKERWGKGWIIGLGFIVAIFFITYQILIITEVVRPLFGIYFVYVYGIVFLALTVSINLATRMAQMNKDIEKQLVYVKELSEKTIEQERKAKDEEMARKLLEADNERKTKELNEARKLQLAMLPKEIPPVPDLDIAVYMKPATEVGGDYYDFKYNNNGSLTIAVGDATGHGMKAGTLVAAIKGLFTAEPVQTEIVSFFNKCNTIIRDMQLGNLYMAMLMARISGKNMLISSAGMPPVLIYRNAKKQVEEIRIQGLPLGGSSPALGGIYYQREIPIAKGDTILLMSDGFPELFNRQKEILDYHTAKEIFLTGAELSSGEIIEHLKCAAEKWMDGAEQQDDITFVVVKVK